MKKKQQTAQAVYELSELNRVKYRAKIVDTERKIEKAQRLIEKLKAQKEQYYKRKIYPHWTAVIDALGAELSTLTGLHYKALGTFGLRAEYCLWLYKEPLHTKYKNEGEPEREHLNTENIIYSLTFTPEHIKDGELVIMYDTGNLQNPNWERDLNGFNEQREQLPMPINAEQVLEIMKQVGVNYAKRGVK